MRLGDGVFTLSVRTRGRPAQTHPAGSEGACSAGSALPFAEIHTLSEEVDYSVAAERLTAALAAIFAGFASVLAAAGIYGLLAFAVEQRRREIGIRMALGARPGQIGSMLGREAAVLLGAGLAVGLAATLLVAGSLRALLSASHPRIRCRWRQRHC